MNIFVYVFFSCLSLFNLYHIQDIDKSVLSALKSSDAKTLSKYFNSSVKVSIHRDDLIANKFQAELILLDYLSDNKLANIRQVSAKMEGTSSFLIYEATAHKKRVRIFFKIVKLKNNEVISELRVE